MSLQLAANSGCPFAVERRVKYRYPLDLNARFRSPISSKLFFSGQGRAINVSSGGLLVLSERAMSDTNIWVGARVEINIEWPFLLPDHIPLQLCVEGRVLRHSQFDFAASVERHQFRTLGSSSQAQTWRATRQLGAQPPNSTKFGQVTVFGQSNSPEHAAQHPFGST